MSSTASWWANKDRQFRSHVRARVSTSERDELAAWLTPAQIELYDAMHVADRRHGLDVVATLRADGVTEPDVLVAGLLHDARSEEHTSELQSRGHLVCRLLLEKKK